MAARRVLSGAVSTAQEKVPGETERDREVSPRSFPAIPRPLPRSLTRHNTDSSVNVCELNTDPFRPRECSDVARENRWRFLEATPI